MKKYLVVFGIFLVLVCSMVILTGCGSAQNSTNENKVEEKTEEKVEEKAAEVVLKDYSYKDLSFKLTSDYEKTDSTSSDTLIYNTDIEEGKMKMFSVGSFSAEGIEDYVTLAADALKEQEFSLTGYKTVSKQDPKVVEYNGIKTLSIDVKYSNDSIKGEGEVEYCYAQKGDTIYVLCFEIFTQDNKKIENNDFSKAFDDVKSSLKFAK